MRKNSFFTFLFSCIPGAGHMYQGLMKRGLSFMLLFSLIIAISAFLNLSILLVVLPVVWFYAFFDSFNYRNMPDEQRKDVKDEFLNFIPRRLPESLSHMGGKQHLIGGVLCILFGFFLLFNTFVAPYIHNIAMYSHFLYRLLNNLPTLLVAAGIILLGIWLVRSKKGQKEEIADDFIGFVGTKGEDNHGRE